MDAWAAKNTLEGRINRLTAIKRFCVAIGGKYQKRYNELHITRTDERKNTKYINSEAVDEFDSKMEKKVEELYARFAGYTDLYANYPYGSIVDITMQPVSVDDFRRMIQMAKGVQK